MEYNIINVVDITPMTDLCSISEFQRWMFQNCVTKSFNYVFFLSLFIWLFIFFQTLCLFIYLFFLSIYLLIPFSHFCLFIYPSIYRLYRTSMRSPLLSWWAFVFQYKIGICHICLLLLYLQLPFFCPACVQPLLFHVFYLLWHFEIRLHV